MNAICITNMTLRRSLEPEEMSNLRVFLASVFAIVLFLFGLEGFSYELQRMGGETISKWCLSARSRRPN